MSDLAAISGTYLGGNAATELDVKEWQKTAADGEYLQFGCGMCAPQTWRNFDAGPAFWLGKKFSFLRRPLVKLGFPNYPQTIEYGDVIKGLGVRPGSAKGIYCSHVLEHLALDEFRISIRNVHQYLTHGGIFRLVVPDLEHLIRCYLQDGGPGAAPRFMRDSLLGQEGSSRGMRFVARKLFGRSQHLWMWDYKAISMELENAGFTGIRRAEFGDSADRRFRDVEDLGRWENCLGVECIRP